MLDAIQSGNAEGLASAVQDLLDLGSDSDSDDSSPSPHTYDSQNELAAKDNK